MRNKRGKIEKFKSMREKATNEVEMVVVGCWWVKRKSLKVEKFFFNELSTCTKNLLNHFGVGKLILNASLTINPFY